MVTFIVWIAGPGLGAHSAPEQQPHNQARPVYTADLVNAHPRNASIQLIWKEHERTLQGNVEGTGEDIAGKE